MCTTTKNYARTGLVNINTANANLDGTGSLGAVLTVSPPGEGVSINAITIKAIGNTTQGMVRLFRHDGSNYFLWKEVNIPANTQTAVVPAFQITIKENLVLNNGDTLYASTQNAESFNIYANGLGWINCDCTSTCTCAESQSFAHTGITTVSQANTHLDGSGAINLVITSPTGSALDYGTYIPTIDIKALQSTTEGMIRLYIYDGTTYFCIWEVPICGSTQTAVEPSFRGQCITNMSIQPGFSLAASTQNAESFNIITFGTDLINCPCP